MPSLRNPVRSTRPDLWGATETPRRRALVRLARALAAIPLVNIAGRPASAAPPDPDPGRRVDLVYISPDRGRSFLLMATGPADSPRWAELAAEGRWSKVFNLDGRRSLAYRHAHRSEVPEVVAGPQPEPELIEVETFGARTMTIRTWADDVVQHCRLCAGCGADRGAAGRIICFEARTADAPVVGLEVAR